MNENKMNKNKPTPTQNVYLFEDANTLHEEINQSPLHHVALNYAMGLVVLARQPYSQL